MRAHLSQALWLLHVVRVPNMDGSITVDWAVRLTSFQAGMPDSHRASAAYAAAFTCFFSADTSFTSSLRVSGLALGAGKVTSSTPFVNVASALSVTTPSGNGSCR